MFDECCNIVIVMSMNVGCIGTRDDFLTSVRCC
jgi:hypothetical protein